MLNQSCSWRKCAGRQLLWEAGRGPPILRVYHCARRAVMAALQGGAKLLSFLSHWTPSQVQNLNALSSTCCHIPLTVDCLVCCTCALSRRLELITVEKKHPVEWSLFNESLLSHKCWKLACFCLRYYLEFNDPRSYFATCLPGSGHWGLTCSMTSDYVHFAYWYAVMGGNLKCSSK